MQEEEGFRAAPYMASRGMKWIQQYSTAKDSDEKLEYYIKEFYTLVSLGLKKKLQKELELNQTQNN